MPPCCATAKFKLGYLGFPLLLYLHLCDSYMHFKKISKWLKQNSEHILIIYINVFYYGYHNRMDTYYFTLTESNQLTQVEQK